MYFSNLFAIVITLAHFASTIVAQNWECTTERYEYAPNEADQFCVFRSFVWKKGTPEPEFPASTASRVAFLDCTFLRIPDRFFDQFLQLEILVVRNSTLEELKISNRMKSVYATKNEIKRLRIDGSAMMLKELHIQENPFSDMDTVGRNLKGLEVLNLSKTTAISDYTIDLTVFAKLPNLTELYLRDVEAYYVENDAPATLANLKVLDLSGNPFTPSNFNFKVFRTLPSLQELYLRDTIMTSLRVGDIREDLPIVKRLAIDGNHFRCDLLELLLAHFKEKGIETDAQSRRCDLGFESIEGLCCMSYIKPVTTPTATTTIATPTKDTDITTADTTITKEHETDKTDTSDSILLYSIIAVVVVVVILLIIAGTMYAMRQKGQLVPTHDNRMPEEL